MIHEVEDVTTMHEYGEKNIHYCDTHISTHTPPTLIQIPHLCNCINPEAKLSSSKFFGDDAYNGPPTLIWTPHLLNCAAPEAGHLPFPIHVKTC